MAKATVDQMRVSVELLVPVTAYIMFMYSWRFAKLKSSTRTLIDHLPYLVYLDADLCKLALNLITFQD